MFTTEFATRKRALFIVFRLDKKRKECQWSNWNKHVTLQLGQIPKTRQKLDFKKMWHWLVILMPATVWQIFDMMPMQWPETEVKSIFWNLRERFVKYHDEFIFWRVLAILNYCALQFATGSRQQTGFVNHFFETQSAARNLQFLFPFHNWAHKK